MAISPRCSMRRGIARMSLWRDRKKHRTLRNLSAFQLCLGKLERQPGRRTMKLSRFLIVLTTVNLAILLFTLIQLRPKVDEVAPVLRGRALQIVDEQGHVRASIAVMPAQAQSNGETYPETVLLRLITERGRPSV